MKKPLVSVAATTILTTALAPQAFVYADTYKVQKGDTLWKIANKYGTSVAKLKEWNQLKSDNILLNQSLIVSTSSSKPNQSQSVSKPTVSDQNQAKTYVVKAGDTLSKIASLHNITLAQLQTWNNLNSYLIYPGDTLKVSQSNRFKSKFRFKFHFKCKRCQSSCPNLHRKGRRYFRKNQLRIWNDH